MWDTSAAWWSIGVDSLPMCPILLVTAGFVDNMKGEYLNTRHPTGTTTRQNDVHNSTDYGFHSLHRLLDTICMAVRIFGASCLGLNIASYFGTSSCVLLMARRSSATPCGKNDQVKVTPIIGAQSVELCSESIMEICTLEAGIVNAKPEINQGAKPPG